MQLDPNPRYVSRLTQRTMALVLAGGRGSRLHALTEWRAKPAVPFGGCFRIIDFALSNCLNSGIRRMGVLTQYKAHSLIRHIQYGWSFLRRELGEFVELMPAQQWGGEHWYAGTADAVHQNMHVIRRHDPDLVLVLAGDHVYKMDYGPMLAQHVETEADVTVGCVSVPLEAASQFGVMDCRGDGRIRGFTEKPACPPPSPGQADRALVSMGIYVFTRRFLNELLAADAGDRNSSHDFGRDLIPGMVRDHRAYAYRFVDATGAEDYWRDVGTIDAFWAANLELTDVTPPLNLYDRDWPIWTYQEQLPPAKFVFDDPGRRGSAVDSLVTSGCVVSGAAVRRSLLFQAVHVEDRAFISDAVVLPRVRVGEGSRIRNAVVDKRCILPPGTVIGEDPAEDARRFHVTESGVVLVTPAMLGQSYDQA